jgi:DNA-binding cell septation regulator SpoVG
MRISSLRKKEGSGKIAAFFSVEITPEITVNDMKLIRSEDGNLWCATPSREYEVQGQKKWSPVVIMSEGLRLQITDLARTAYHGEATDETIPF